MKTSVYKSPTVEPIHLTEAKLHLRLAVDASGAASYTDEDAFLSSIIAASRDIAEAETWRKMVMQTVDYYLDSWPNSNEILLPHAPLREVVHVKYTNSAGTTSTFSDYSADTDSVPGRIVLDYQETWPSDTLAPKNPIHIRFTTGHVVPFTADDSTDVLTAADHPFSDGDIVQLSVSGGALPTGLAALTNYHVRDVSGDTLKLAASAGGVAINITSTGSGSMFIGAIPPGIMAGMKLVLTDLYEERGDTVVGKTQSALPETLPRGAARLFAMDAAKTF